MSDQTETNWSAFQIWIQKNVIFLSRMIYVNVNSHNLGFPYFDIFGGDPVKKKHPVHFS